MVSRLLFATIFAFCFGVNAMRAPAFVLSDDSIRELRGIDPSTAKEIAYILLDVAKEAQSTHKRNSEIINSLLGLPKVLNDAGR